MNSPDPVPRDFGWRYIAWLAWSNAVSILATLQAIFAAITLDPDTSMVSHGTYHWISIASLALTVIVAQLKKNTPPGPPPLKQPTNGAKT